jgi:RNA-directed DNA polymerase
MNDRALQALTKLALEPEWEARFEPNSYGFRPGRSCHDAVEAIFLAIRYKAKYVLDADISKCFDQIDHEALLRKLNTSPTIRRQIRAWLKAGVIDRGQLFPTSEGTPQGGVVSPLLANIALHGMEERIKEFAKTLDIKNSKGKQISLLAKSKRLNLIRYADDLVILHEDITVVQRCREIISEWLKDMGLELKPSKTRITHTLKGYENEKPGFDFLGFHIQHNPVGKYVSGKNAQGKLLGFKTIITPSNKSVRVHYEEVARVIDTHTGLPQTALISNLTPKMKGWANYYATVCSKECYSKLDNLMYSKLKIWAKRRQPNKTEKWFLQKYWQSIDGNNWVFATRQEVKNPMRLHKYEATKIKRHIKVKGEASPYDGNLVYWSTRIGEHPEMPKRTASLLKMQKGKCAHCGLYFKDGDLIELDHIIPKSKGGKDEYKNWQLLHRHCHDIKTANDSSQGTQSGCNSAEPKPPIKTDWLWIDDMLVMRYV